MIAFSACIGVGLFLQSGQVIFIAGPGLAIISFALAATVMWAVMGSLGEMTALFPVQGPLFEFSGRFLDESVGYATGWITWFAYAAMNASELMSVAKLWKFRFSEDYLQEVGYPDKSLGWGSTEGVSPAVWCFLFLIVNGLVNLLPVRAYGWVEYVVGVAKITFIVFLIVFNIIISAVQPVPHASHFWTWNKPYSFSSPGFSPRPSVKNPPVIEGDLGHFLTLFTTMRIIFFAMLGFETVAITAPENKNLEIEETLKLASRKIVLRISVLYIMAVFTVGLNVPYNDTYLRDLNINSFPGGQNSIFIIAAVRNQLRGWPHFFNGFFILSAASSGILTLYCASRILHALAGIPEAWPLWAQSLRRRLERTNSYGIPISTIVVSWLFGLLAFLSIKGSAATYLNRLSLNAVISILIVYATICASYIQFYFCIKRAANDNRIDNHSIYNRDHEYYPYRSHGQVFRAIYGFAFSVFLIFFTGWQSFVKPFDRNEFIASYISIIVFFALIAAYHVKSDGWNPLKWRRAASMQLARPPPMVVAPGRRRGQLIFPNRKKCWSEENFKALMEWVWCWLK
ncbi:hypothetical protein AOQ84DRAFT_411865 [Glonium stellatum]|uniref:Amino acid permease/ SLC12A domain-containing protein n=1 Tax=Glonium stellatum TaxID=574774 RepID=A0A8E2FG10_9PEZI|nr:hypothetical protein AOQ84DRAFT_411865 [Glonium stellatum]